MSNNCNCHHHLRPYLCLRACVSAVLLGGRGLSTGLRGRQGQGHAVLGDRARAESVPAQGVSLRVGYGRVGPRDFSSRHLYVRHGDVAMAAPYM